MQPGGQDPSRGMPPFSQTPPFYTPEQAQMWQQYGMPPPPFTPEAMQYMQQQGMTQPHLTPEALQYMHQQGLTQPQLTPEALQYMQQQGMVQPQFTPEALQYMQQQGMIQQQVTPEMLQQWEYQLYQMQQAQQPQGGQPASTVEIRGGRRSEEREGRGFGRFLAVLAVLALLGGGAWFLFFRETGPSTAVIEISSLGTIHRGDALIVRNETAFEDEGVQSMDYVAQEGSLVYQGNVVCYVYSTGYSAKEIQTLQNYRDQIKNYERSLLRSQIQTDSRLDRLETEVIQRGLEVRSLVQGARGNLINQESILRGAIEQRQSYFRSAFSSDMRLSQLLGDEATQKQRIESWITQHHASRRGIVSFYTDGFERALTRDLFETYTPSEVRAMINGQKPEVSTAARGRISIYRLVSETDYAVLMLVKDQTWNPVEGSVHKLKLEQFSNTVVDARIRSFTRSGGELLLRLEVMGDVMPVLYMRACQAELGEYVDALRVPAAAIYEQGGSKGVVLVNGDQQIFVPVKLVQEEGGMAFISPVQPGSLNVGQTVRLFR